ncbi:hypothetical protein J4474_04055 [Candidatus Pacearchaeota archaeon]|nr:hypothetical protein [Candidatus Pacearchaeota archaeon]
MKSKEKFAKKNFPRKLQTSHEGNLQGNYKKINYAKSSKDGVLEFSFSWLFAIIIGGAIIFLAIFAAVKIIGLGNTQSDVTTAREIGIILNPLESSFTTGTTTSFDVPTETRIYNACDDLDGNFGKEIISVSQKNLGKWSEPENPVGFSNKYIFSENPIEGKKFYIFSKPLEMPFKVADLIYLTSDSKDYCFEEMPESDLKNEIGALSSSNPKLQIENCSQNSIKVCFGSSSGVCNVAVSGFLDEAGYVEKNGEQMSYAGNALMIAAIFSEKEIYECQVKRIMKRISSLAIIYSEKSKLISKNGCGTNFGSELINFARTAGGITSSSQINSIMENAKVLEDTNQNLGECRLW